MWAKSNIFIKQIFKLALVCDEQLTSNCSTLESVPITVNKNQYLVCHPLATVATLILRYIEFINALTFLFVMLFNFSNNAFLNFSESGGGMPAPPLPSVQLSDRLSVENKS